MVLFVCTQCRIQNRTEDVEISNNLTLFTKCKPLIKYNHKYSYSDFDKEYLGHQYLYAKLHICYYNKKCFETKVLSPNCQPPICHQ